MIYAALKHNWAFEDRKVAFNQLKAFTKHIADCLGLSFLDEIEYPIAPNEIQCSTLKLLARCYLKIGDWQIELQDEWSEAVVPRVLKAYLVATQCDSGWYRAWHQWAFANFEGKLEKS